MSIIVAITSIAIKGAFSHPSIGGRFQRSAHWFNFDRWSLDHLFVISFVSATSSWMKETTQIDIGANSAVNRNYWFDARNLFEMFVYCLSNLSQRRRRPIGELSDRFDGHSHDDWLIVERFARCIEPIEWQFHESFHSIISRLGAADHQRDCRGALEKWMISEKLLGPIKVPKWLHSISRTTTSLRANPMSTNRRQRWPTMTRFAQTTITVVTAAVVQNTCYTCQLVLRTTILLNRHFDCCGCPLISGYLSTPAWARLDARVIYRLPTRSPWNLCSPTLLKAQFRRWKFIFEPTKIFDFRLHPTRRIVRINLNGRLNCSCELTDFSKTGQIRGNSSRSRSFL